MRILSTKQIREIDAYTIAHEPIASIELMERASRAFVDWFTMNFTAKKRIGVVCGTGNNGGDGLAIARMLHDWGYSVAVWIIRGGAAESGDFRVNFERLAGKVSCAEITEGGPLPSFDGYDVLIDAIFGSGLSRAPAGVYAHVINMMNEAAAIRVAVDIPSGLLADAHASGAIVKAAYTVTFQLPKLAFMLPESFPFTGEWVTVNIGLDKAFIREAPATNYYTRLKDVQKILKPRLKFDHKGDFGRAMLVAGSYGKIGAAILAARACVRSGVGLLTVHAPECGYGILQTAVPEAMVEVDPDVFIFSKPVDAGAYDVLGIGPGLGRDERTAQALRQTLERFEKPVVLDADALNILSANRQFFHLIPEGSILTPHPREFERLTGPWKDDFERLEMQRQLANHLRSVVVLKGAHTSIAVGEEVHFNSTGNPGMATGGTGDVLTGVLTALLAQNYSPAEAAIMGVFLHGSAGDLAADTLGMESMNASDVIDHLPSAFQKLHRKYH